MGAAGVEADVCEHRGCPLATFTRGESGEHQRHLDVLQGGECGKPMKRLEDEPHVGASIAGEISRVEEQERLRDRFWQVFGRDPESVGHFAYSVSLMRSAEAGAIPIKEAEALVGAREAAIMAMKMESRRVPSSYEYPEN